MTITAEPRITTEEDIRSSAHATLADLQVNISELRHRARCHYERIEDFQSGAAHNYYLRNGYDEHGARALFDLVKKFLAVSAAWYSMGSTFPLRLPRQVEIDGWQGFIIQTRDYAALARRIGTFVDHATDLGTSGNDDAAAVTALIVDIVFGMPDRPMT